MKLPDHPSWQGSEDQFEEKPLNTAELTAVLQYEIARLTRECDELRVKNTALAEANTALQKASDQSVPSQPSGDTAHSRKITTSPFSILSTFVRNLFAQNPNNAKLDDESSVSSILRAQRWSGGDFFVVSDMPPLFDQQSGALRMMTLLQLMNEAGWRITFGSYIERSKLPLALTSNEGRARYEGALYKHGVQCILYGMDEINTYLRKKETRLNWAFVSFPHIASAVMPLVRARFPNALIAFDMVDFHSLRLEREAELLGDSEKLAQARHQREEEIGLALAADVTLAITAEEKENLLSLAPLAVVKVLPNVFELPQYTPPGPTERNGVFFLGGFWHAPNSDGIKWFVEKIWPFVRAKEPNAILRIAGSNMNEDILALSAVPGIEVLGYVPYLQPLFDSNRVFIAPLRYGAGMKGKVGQSLAHGLPVVATTIGAEGMSLVDGTHILVADEESAFADHIVQVLRDDSLWCHLSEHGRTHIEKTLSLDVVRTQVGDIFHG